MKLTEIVGGWGGGPVRAAGSGLETDSVGGETVAVQVASDDGAVVVLNASWDAPAGVDETTVSDLAATATEQRSGMLNCIASGATVRIETTVYLEGASRQSITTAVLEMARAYSFLKGFTESLGAGGAAVLEAERAVAEARKAMDVGAAAIAEADARSAASAREADAHLQQQAQTLQQPTVAAPQASWNPTFKVPMQGMTSWAAPDPKAAETAKLDPGLDLEVVERLGDWAQVRASNGWMGWVDGRALQAR
jgi:hypothetical protein